jgi:MoaA/NifB/PqqE/SkfB family radical SAM enzyme
MPKAVALTGETLRRFRRDMTRRAMELCWSEVRRDPASAAARLAALVALGKVSRVYMSGLKAMRFGPSVKAGPWMPHWPSEAFDVRVRRAIEPGAGPHHEQVVLCVTDDCPYRCPHCFNHREHRPALRMGRLREVVGEIQGCGGSWLCIEGGEPLLAMERTLAVLRAADGRSEVWLTTTGFGLEAATPRELRDAGLFGALVSLHSDDPAVHDAFVGYRGAFRIALDAIERFRQADVFVSLNTVLPKDRITPAEIGRIMALAEDLGVAMVEVLVVRPAGRAVVGCERLQAKQDEHRVLSHAMQIFNKDPSHAAAPGLVAPAYFEHPDRFGCVAGNERVFIGTSGDVQPCPMVNLSVGSVARESFTAVAGRMRRLLRYPRRDLLCTQLQPLIADALGSRPGVALPLEPRQSAEILGAVPGSAIPGAFCR